MLKQFQRPLKYTCAESSNYFEQLGSAKRSLMFRRFLDLKKVEKHCSSDWPRQVIINIFVTLASALVETCGRVVKALVVAVVEL